MDFHFLGRLRIATILFGINHIFLMGSEKILIRCYQLGMDDV